MRDNVFAAAVLALAIMVPTAHAQDTIDDFYEDARRYEAQGDVSAAIIQLKNALQLDNQHTPSLLLFAELQRDLGNTGIAAETYSDALLVGADPSYVVPKLADVYVRQGRFRRVLDELDPQQLSGSPRAELLGYHALAQMQLGQRSEARKLIDAALEIDRFAISPAVAQVTLHLDAGEREEAQRLSEVLVQRSSDDADLWFLRASILVDMRNIPDARAAFDRAVASNERLIAARLGRAELLLAQGKFDEAEIDVSYMSRTFPEEPRGALLEARLHRARGEEALAEESYARAANLVARVDEGVVARNEQLTLIGAEAQAAIGAQGIAIQILQDYQATHERSERTGIMLVDMLLARDEGTPALRVLEPLLKFKPDSLRLLARRAEAESLRGAHRDAIAIWQRLKAEGVSTLEVDVAIAESQISAGEIRLGSAGLESVLAREPNRDAQRYLLADTYLDNGLLVRAAAHIRVLLNRDPRNAQYLTLMGKAQRLAGEPEAAKSYYNAALQEQPDSETIQLELVALEVGAGDVEDAVARLERLDEAYPGSFVVKRERARVEFQREDLDEALRWAERAITEAPDDLDAARLMVDIHLARGDTAGAMEVSRQFSQRYNKDIEAQFLFAETLEKVGAADDAIVEYKIISRNVDIPGEQLYRVAMAQRRLGALEDAAAVLFAAQREAPDMRIYKEAAIDVMLRMEKFQQGLEAAQELAAEYPSDTYPQVLLARAYMGLQEYDQAANAFGKARSFSPGARDILIGWQRALVLAGNTRKAEQLLADWLREHPDDAMIRYTYGGLFIYLNRPQEAQAQFQQIVDEGTDNPLVLNNLAYVQHELGDRGALAVARRAYDMAPELPEINDTLGWILVEQGQPDEALPYLREAVARRSDNAALRYHLGAALIELGRTFEGRDELKLAMEMTSDTQQRAEIQALLATVP